MDDDKTTAIFNKECRIQKLYIKLFFCESTLNSYKNNLHQLLVDCSLDKSAIRFFPDIESESFQIESHGRKMNVAVEIFERYKVFFSCYVNKSNINLDEILNLKLFKEFLSSDYFFCADYSIPHPYDIGLGYENVSKFYFFIINCIPISHQSLMILKKSFGYYIMKQINRGPCEFYNQFCNGLFIQDNKLNKSFIITPECKMLTLEFQEKEYFLKKKIFDIDSLNRSIKPNNHISIPCN